MTIRLELRVGWTGEDRLEVTEGDSEPYGPLPSELPEWQPKTHHVVAVEDHRTIGHADLLRAHVRHEDGTAADVVGLGSVLVAPSRRFEGVGHLLVRGALDEGRTWELLFCRSELVGFYESLGWSRLVDPPHVEHARVRVQLPESVTAMRFAFSTEHLMGISDVLGPPF
jgi:GNAT superfamily N-acetyltransferase